MCLSVVTVSIGISLGSLILSLAMSSLLMNPSKTFFSVIVFWFLAFPIDSQNFHLFAYITHLSFFSMTAWTSRGRGRWRERILRKTPWWAQSQRKQGIISGHWGPYPAPKSSQPLNWLSHPGAPGCVIFFNYEYTK